ncbi:MAG: acetate--CoA ligase alpha subunit [Planctomycetota bacterium]|jgi:acetyltransferase
MSLKQFFNPKSVAVVGASRQEGKVGYEILKNISSSFEGDIYPINPKSDTIEGLKCYPDLKSTGQVPELAIIVIPAKIVPNIMRECGQIGVKSVIIITAGFKEIGAEGKELEKQILSIAKQAGIRIIGPNCLGVIAPSNKLNASFGGDMPLEGGIGYISQSGALMAAILDMANANGIGFSKLVSIGNKSDINELDMVKALGEDQATSVIAGYLESITDGNLFVRQAESISHIKPIILIKSGTSSAGAKAASSHTGSLAGGEVAYESAFARAGIIRCNSIKEQFDYARAFSDQPLPGGPSVAVITNAGGPGILAADAIEGHGLSFAQFSEQTIEKLKENLPPAANVYNPVDILGDGLADRYESALDIVLDDENVDAVMILLTPQAMTQPTETAEALAKISGQKPDKPIFCCFLGAEKIKEGIEILRKAKIPYYDSSESTVKTIKVMADYSKWRSRPKRIVKLFAVNRRKVENIIDRHFRSNNLDIGETDSKAILEAYGFKTPDGTIANTAEQAANIAQQIGYPVVLKVWSSEILHKSDVGGVRIGIKNEQEVKDAFDLMMYRIPQKCPEARILGILVEKMHKVGKEVILGMSRDPSFGPILMFGMGGIMVEALKDVSFYLAPLTPGEAREMLMNTKTYKLLKGFRGQKGVDIDAIAEGLQRLSQLAMEFPQIQELDINPFVVGREGTTPIAVDGRIRIDKV